MGGSWSEIGVRSEGEWRERSHLLNAGGQVGEVSESVDRFLRLPPSEALAPVNVNGEGVVVSACMQGASGCRDRKPSRRQGTSSWEGVCACQGVSCMQGVLHARCRVCKVRACQGVVHARRVLQGGDPRTRVARLARARPRL